MKHKVDKSVMGSLWERVKDALAQPVSLFVNVGIRPTKGEKKKDAEFKVWMEVVRAAFEEGVALGYDMGMSVAGAPDPAPDAQPVDANKDGE